jgi:hypothetical protein
MVATELTPPLLRAAGPRSGSFRETWRFRPRVSSRNTASTTRQPVQDRGGSPGGEEVHVTPWIGGKVGFIDGLGEHVIGRIADF